MTLLILSLISAAGEWRTQQNVDGMNVEVRSVTGSGFEEVRVTTKSTAPIDKLCQAVWGDGNMKVKEPGFKLRRVIHETDDERLTYEQVNVPIVSDRDYTIHARRLREPSTGLCQVFFETQNDKGPPPQPGFVRIPKIYGSWTIEPLDEGGALVSYLVFSDPGGGVPAFLARGKQRKSVVSFMKLILQRAAQ
jgi:hypothetical protein